MLWMASRAACFRRKGQVLIDKRISVLSLLGISSLIVIGLQTTAGYTCRLQVPIQHKSARGTTGIIEAINPKTNIRGKRNPKVGSLKIRDHFPAIRRGSNDRRTEILRVRALCKSDSQDAVPDGPNHNTKNETLRAAGGLKGVVLGDSRISVVGDPGRGLQYRGFPVVSLAVESSFEEVAYLLIYGLLPSQLQLAQFRARLSKHQELTPALESTLSAIPQSAHSMDVLRTGCSILGALEINSMSSHQQSIHAIKEESQKIAEKLLALFPSMILHWLKKSGSPITPDVQDPENFSIAERIVKGLGIHERNAAQIVDRVMILYAEHDLNASTFAARVTASTQADFYSSVCSALSTLRGPLHGGALAGTIELIDSFSAPRDAAHYVRSALARGQILSGFGHRVYRKDSEGGGDDPRSTMIKAWASELAQTDKKRQQKMAIAEAIEDAILEEKGLRPNVDYYTALVFDFLGIPQNIFVALFALARLAGWSAHIIEQGEEKKLIRPISNYVGPVDLPYIPLDSRNDDELWHFPRDVPRTMLH